MGAEVGSYAASSGAGFPGTVEHALVEACKAEPRGEFWRHRGILRAS